MRFVKRAGTKKSILRHSIFRGAMRAEGDEQTVNLGFDGNFTEVITGSDANLGTRSSQQDAHFVSQTASSDAGLPIKAFGVLCDGMGGLEDGEKASRIAVDLFSAALEGITGEESIERIFMDEIHKIDASICAACGFDPGGMPRSGTTLSAVLIYGQNLYWASVGDSRIYILRGEDMVQVSRDHNYAMILNDYVRQGKLSAEEAKGHPKKGALISFVGSGQVRYIDLNTAPFVLSPGDIVLLCSDGLIKSLSDAEIHKIIRRNYGDMDAAAKELTRLAFDTGDGAKDNTSVILMQYLI